MSPDHFFTDKKPAAIIFDLDGTLVSSSLDFSIIRESLGCPQNVDILAFVNRLPTQARSNAENKIIEFEIADALSSQKLNGTDELLALLASLNLPVAIVTRNCQQAAQIKLSKNNLDIPIVLTREHHPAKPAPDALLHIANQWQILPQDIMYIGDYLYDIQAADNARMMSCLLTYGQPLHYADLATVVVDDLNKLVQMFKLYNKEHSNTADYCCDFV